MIKEDQNNRCDMQKLIQPDWSNNLVTRLEGINDQMGSQQHRRSQRRSMCKEHKNRCICRAMIKIHLPTFPLLHTHPGAWKGKIPHKMAGQPDQQDWERDST